MYEGADPPVKQFYKDKLDVRIYGTRDEMGNAAAADIKACILKLLETKAILNMIFAAAPSQNEVLASLAGDPEIPWNRVQAFHMDEYIGLSPDAPQGFGNFLRRALFDLAPFAKVNYIDCAAADAQAECDRYAGLLRKNPVDIVVMGIGENGHIAFNDPPVADFADKALVKIVELDPICRQQQVNDGCFAGLSQVPTHALTLTVPALMAAQHRFCIVPAPTKAKAVAATVHGAVGEHCPATCLRVSGGVLYLDPDSASLL